VVGGKDRGIFLLCLPLIKDPMRRSEMAKETLKRRLFFLLFPSDDDLIFPIRNIHRKYPHKDILLLHLPSHRNS